MKISIERLKEIIQEEITDSNKQDGLSEGVLDAFKKKPESDIRKIIRHLHEARTLLFYGGKWSNPIPETLEAHYASIRPRSIDLPADTTYKMLLSPLINFFKQLEKEEAEEVETEEEQ